MTYVAAVDLAEPNACSVHVAAILAEFATRGHATTLVAPRPRGSAAADMTRGGVRVRYVARTAARLPNAAAFPFLLPSVVRSIIGGRGRVVYVRFGSLSLMITGAARALRRSYVVSEHNGWVQGELLQLGHRPHVARLVGWAQVLDARVAHRVVAVSPRIRDHLMRAGVPADKIVVAENGTDTDRLRPLDRASALALWAWPPERAYLGFLGTLTAWQGVDAAVRALPGLAVRVPSVHLLVGGDGPERVALETLARDLGVAERTTFAGHVPLEHAAAFLSCVDVAIIPRSRGIAALGMSPLKLRDYAAAGRAVVAPDLPGIREHADGGWLAMYDPDDASAFEARLADVLLDDARRTAMGRAGRAYAEERFSWSRTADLILSSLEVDQAASLRGV